ncbi:hypothetical protein ACODYM_29405 [Burkholderia gladioli]|uniref:hypothetical protein n=1 Tax=Burkholderia gladioli TaxID=28095 RepID=UPI003B513940
MPVNTTGAEFKRFYNDPTIWKKDVWHDDVILMVDGVQLDEGSELDQMLDAAIVKIESGVVYLNGDASDDVPLDALFRRWRRTQTHRVMQVEVPTARYDELRAAFTALGGKVTE